MRVRVRVRVRDIHTDIVHSPPIPPCTPAMYRVAHMPRLKGLRMSSMPPRRARNTSVQGGEGLADATAAEGESGERRLMMAVAEQRAAAVGTPSDAATAGAPPSSGATALKVKNALHAGARWIDAGVTMLSLGATLLLHQSCDWEPPERWTAAEGLQAATLTVFTCALLMAVPRRVGEGAAGQASESVLSCS